MFNERDQRCTAVQLMLSTDPSHDNRTIANTLKMQIWIATNNRDVPMVMKTKFPIRLWSLVRFQVRATSCYLTSSKSAWKSIPKCTWMCLRVWWSPGAIRWPVADSGYGSSIRHRPSSPKRPIRRVFAELPPALVEKACSQFRIRIVAVIEAETSYIELMSALLHNQVTWIDFLNKSFKIKL